MLYFDQSAQARLSHSTLMLSEDLPASASPFLGNWTALILCSQDAISFACVYFRCLHSTRGRELQAGGAPRSRCLRHRATAGVFLLLRSGGQHRSPDKGAPRSRCLLRPGGIQQALHHVRSRQFLLRPSPALTHRRTTGPAPRRGPSARVLHFPRGAI